jgi:DNA-binding IclR family transcriptional regulator
MTKPDKRATPSRGIQSVAAALETLAAMTRRQAPVSLSELARDCRMPPSKVHRYLTTFQNAGLVVQAGRSGKYDLGPGAVTLGLSAIGRYDFVNRASELLPDLCSESGLTALLSVWGNQGPTVIRWQRASAPPVTSMGLGTTLPLISSATGRAFLAWGPPALMKSLRDTELRRARQKPAIASDLVPTNEGLEMLLADMRAKGFAWVDGKFIPGLAAIAAPILDWQGEAQTVVTLVNTDPAIIEPRSDAVRHLIAFCQTQSFASMKSNVDVPSVLHRSHNCR